MATEAPRTGAPAWIRYAGIVIVVAALLELATGLAIGVLFPEAFTPGTSDEMIVANVVLAYLVLGFVGVGALYAHYGESFGRVGNLGLVSIAVGIVVGVASIALTGSAAADPLNLVLVFGGAGLLAVGLWRTPAVPRSAALLMAATPVAAVVGIVGFATAPEGLLGILGYLTVSVVWAAAWIVLGVHLWRQGPDRGASQSTAGGASHSGPR